jgi:hypothetical protein
MCGCSTATSARWGAVVELPDGELDRALDVDPMVDWWFDECGITHRLAVGDVIHLR